MTDLGNNIQHTNLHTSVTRTTLGTDVSNLLREGRNRDDLQRPLLAKWKHSRSDRDRLGQYDKNAAA